MFMLDTDTCIYLINDRDEALREKFESNARTIRISSITYAELCFGAAHSARVEANMQELEAFCLDRDSAGTHTAQSNTWGKRSLDRSPRSQRGRHVGHEQRREIGRVPDLRMENWLANAVRRATTEALTV